MSTALVKQKSKQRAICRVCEDPIILSGSTGKRCKGCGAWNHSEAEDTFDDGSITLDQVRSADHDRISTGAWDYCWGGKQICPLCQGGVVGGRCKPCDIDVDESAPWRHGIVQTSCTLLGGYPGAGKSTLLLQLAQGFYRTTGRESLYIATEEALDEVKARADRLLIDETEQKSVRMVPAMGGTADMGEILSRRNPGVIIVDSLQGLVGDNQAACINLLALFKKFSVTLRAPSIVISHFTKEGDYAGVMTLQHAVDSLLTLAPADDGTRILDVRKNRNGKAFIEFRFEMTAKGLIALPDDQQSFDQKLPMGEDAEGGELFTIANRLADWALTSADPQVADYLARQARKMEKHARSLLEAPKDEEE